MNKNQSVIDDALSRLKTTTQMTVRVSQDLADRVRERAVDADVTMNELVAAVLAEVFEVF